MRSKRFLRSSQGDRNYPEDVAKGGVFTITCKHCRKAFSGHKRREHCRACVGIVVTPVSALVRKAVRP